jgi:putative DNA-invertase from lambdoid prophage Rac
MNIAIYVRVSTEEQTTENQIIKLKEYADRLNWNYIIFEEQESTRKTRPIKNALYLELLQKKYDGLLIYKFDRWARSTTELISEIQTLINRGISIHSYTEALDLTSSMGKAMLTILSAFAQLERDLIRERTLAGLHRAKLQGKTLGRPKGKKDSKYRKRRRIKNPPVIY